MKLKTVDMGFGVSRKGAKTADNSGLTPSLIFTEVLPLSATPLKIEFPESLPVSAKRDEIAQAMAEHQVIIVCGETGSGKTTQLPKIALALGRGKLNAAPGQRGKWIGHTQPRRIAASSVAKVRNPEVMTRSVGRWLQPRQDTVDPARRS